MHVSYLSTVSHTLLLRAGFTIAVVAACAYSGTAVAQNQNPGTSGPAAGHKVYMQARCYACHGEMGFGGVGPRFREDHFVGMGDYVVGQILIGRGVMPSFADALDNKQIAEVATYIRNSWGNNFGPVKSAEVEHVRQQIKMKPPQGRPHVQPQSHQPPGVPVPPQGAGSPGQALPPQGQ